MIKEVEKGEAAVRSDKKETIIQEKFPKTMNKKFPKLCFHNTHAINHILKHQKPAVLGTKNGLHPHIQTALFLVELKRLSKDIDGKAKGQLISAINRMFEELEEKREIWGFFVVHGTEGNFLSIINLRMEIIVLRRKFIFQQFLPFFGRSKELPTKKFFPSFLATRSDVALVVVNRRMSFL